MKKQTKSLSLRVIMISFCVLALLSSGIFYYSNGMGNEPELELKSTPKAKLIKPVLKENISDKEMILRELNDLKKIYDGIIEENKKMSLELVQERDKVMKLMSDLIELKDSEVTLEIYEDQVKGLQEKLKKLTVENVKLKEQNIMIVKQNGVIKEQRDITEVVLKESQKNTESLKKDLVSVVEKSSKLAVSETTVIAYRLKNSGELIVTDKASKVDGINVSFIIAKNEMAKPIDKVYFIQIINSENIVVGDSKEGTHQYKSLTYSFATNVSYEKKTVHVSENFLGNKFSKGTYYVNIYDKEELVDESSFSLK